MGILIWRLRAGRRASCLAALIRRRCRRLFVGCKQPQGSLKCPCSIGRAIYVALALVDVDEAGDLDLAAGSHLVNLQNATDGGLLLLNQSTRERSGQGKVSRVVLNSFIHCISGVH